MIDYNAPAFYYDGYDDAGDVRKVEYHLRLALDNISNIFEVSFQKKVFNKPHWNWAIGRHKFTSKLTCHL